jgi:hypothetical protein
MEITSRKTYPDWADIAFTALPVGWVNVFKGDDGTHYTEPCPGVLIQECATLTEIWSEEHDDGRVDLRSQKRDADREIRTVFVCAGYIGESFLRPVDDEPGYVVTTTPEQWAAWNADVAAETTA